MSSISELLPESVAPLVDRILSNPLTFVPARYPDREVSAKPTSYIILSSISSQGQDPSIQKPVSFPAEHQKEEPEMRKPRSMAEAVAAYTGKRFLTKAEKKAEKRRLQDEKLAIKDIEEPHTNEDVGEVVTNLAPNAGRSDDSQSDEYESASEYPTTEAATSSNEESSSDGSFKLEIGAAQTKEEFEEHETKDDIEGEDQDDDEDDDEEDEDFNSDDENSSSDESASDDEGTLNPEDENDEVSQDEDDDIRTEGKYIREDNNNEKKKQYEKETNDNAIDEKSSVSSLEEETPKDVTPPTSPDNDSAKIHLDEYYRINENPNDKGSNQSNRIYKSWRNLVGSKPLGLLNHGVTCYTNSAVQAMVHIPAVQHYLNDVYEGKHDKVLKPRSVSHVLAEIAHRMWQLDNTSKRNQKKKNSTPKYVNPKKIIQRLEDINCMMSEWQQEDSHEYFMSLLSRLQEDSTPKGVKLNESIIYDIFGGLLNQSVTCKSCGHVSETKQEFYDLSLGLDLRKKKKTNQETENATQSSLGSNVLSEQEVPEKPARYSIENSLKDFFSSELIKTDKKDKTGYICEKCKQRTNAIKISSIDRAPETLAIHIKRFRFNGSSSSKVKHPVSFSSLLDLSEYVTDKNEHVLYKLISVIVHEGRSVSSGHYIAHCLQPDNTWATYDDEYVNHINEKEVLKDPSAYFLIYTRLTHKSDVTGNKKRSSSGNGGGGKRPRS